MKIIDVDDERYQVCSRIESQDEDFINKLTELYKDRYNDFFLLKAKDSPATKPHHLICRKLDDANYNNVVPPKKKRQRKKHGLKSG